MLYLIGCLDYDFFGADSSAPNIERDPTRTGDIKGAAETCQAGGWPAVQIAADLATCSPLGDDVEWAVGSEALFLNTISAGPGFARTRPSGAGRPVELLVTAGAAYGVLGADGAWLQDWETPANINDLTAVSFRAAEGDFTAFAANPIPVDEEPVGYSVNVVPWGETPTFPKVPTILDEPGAHQSGGSSLGLADHDGDGIPVIYDMRATWSVDGLPITEFETTATSETPLVPLFLPADGTGPARLANAAGIWDFDTGVGVRWDREFVDRVLLMGARDASGELVVVVGGWGMLCSMNAETGRARWCQEVESNNQAGARAHVAAALGDVDGDGIPEICAPWGDDSVLFDLDGTVRWRVHRTDKGHLGACVMADLDADGRYEVVDWSSAGLRILDGRTGATLADNGGELVDGWGYYDGPFVADLDADGSAEIFVSGVPAGGGHDPRERESFVAIYGSPTNAWAPTRPVWNQVGYDITTVNDDGSLVPWPEPVWDSYNAYRAQPAMAGDFADLKPELAEACAESCEAEGEVVLSARVHNFGSRDAEPGAEVALLTDYVGGLTEVARVVLPAAIPAMTTSASVELRLPAGQLGTRQFLKVHPSDPRNECDFGNDRVEVDINVCPDEHP
jgi:hypothetical protein